MHNAVSAPVISLQDVTFSFGSDTVFRNLSLDVRQGEYLGVIGPNGGGKSTLIKMMLGLLPPTSGTVELFGTDVRSFRDWQRVAYVSQKATHVDATFPITVEGVVAMGRYPRCRRLQRLGTEGHARITAALQQVGIEALRTRRIGDLSGGQQQRVFLARALAGEPDVIVLDEPTTGVDAATQEQLYALLRTLHREAGLTLIFASHDITTLAREATTIAIVQHGVRFYGTPEELRANPDYTTILQETECFHRH